MFRVFLLRHGCRRSVVEHPVLSATSRMLRTSGGAAAAPVTGRWKTNTGKIEHGHDRRTTTLATNPIHQNRVATVGGGAATVHARSLASRSAVVAAPQPMLVDAESQQNEGNRRTVPPGTAHEVPVPPSAEALGGMPLVDAVAILQQQGGGLAARGEHDYKADQRSKGKGKKGKGKSKADQKGTGANGGGSSSSSSSISSNISDPHVHMDPATAACIAALHRNWFYTLGDLIGFDEKDAVDIGIPHAFVKRLQAISSSGEGGLDARVELPQQPTAALADKHNLSPCQQTSASTSASAWKPQPARVQAPEVKDDAANNKTERVGQHNALPIAPPPAAGGTVARGDRGDSIVSNAAEAADFGECTSTTRSRQIRLPYAETRVMKMKGAQLPPYREVKGSTGTGSTVLS